MKRFFLLGLVTLLMPAVVTAKTFGDSINESLQPIADAISNFVFYAVPVTKTVDMPLVVIFLLTSAIVFTLYFGFINFRGFWLAVNTVRGKYDDLDDRGADVENVFDVEGDIMGTIKDESEHGEVSHFQALTAALSGTVGLGNIGGVAVAISIGGPGATFWMIVAGLLGMASKFTECTLGVKYREIGPDGTVYGGPMYYLKKGLATKNLTFLGKVLSVVFAICCLGGSFGGGNMFQSNQAFEQLEKMARSPMTAVDQSLVDQRIYYYDSDQAITGNFVVSAVSADKVSFHPVGSPDKIIEVASADVVEKGMMTPLNGKGFWFGVIVALIVALVIIGGIKRIGAVTEKVVPFMVGIYVFAAMIVLLSNISLIPGAFGQIFSGAFSPDGITGGIVGVLIVGMQRAAFSNEAGVGSAAIAHSAVRTKFPASEGIVALMEPFIDTVIVCTMTALVIIVTNYDGGLMVYGQTSPEGVEATSRAFESVIPWFPYVLTFAVLLFAISTMLSWSYYGLQSWMFLFGKSKIVDLSYKIIFCIFIVVGASMKLKPVIDFSDAMIFAMSVPNLIGLYILMPYVKDELKKYKDAIRAMK